MGSHDAEHETRPWTDDELVTMHAKFGSTSNVAMASMLRRDLEDVEAKAAEMALGKNKAAFVGLRKMPRWTAGELAHLADVYPHSTNVAIAHELGRTLKSVASKASKLGLRKSDERLKAMGESNITHRRPRPQALPKSTANKSNGKRERTARDE